MTSRLIDVTEQIQNFHRIYGGSDSTNQEYVASSRCLNYGKGASIQKPEIDKVSDIPRSIEYKDTVGLFGAENHFVKVTLALQNPITGIYDIEGYEAAKGSEEPVDPADEYTFLNGPKAEGQALIDPFADLDSDDTCSEYACTNFYQPARLVGEAITELDSKYFKVEIKNLKTGNIYVDSWLDVRLYNRKYDEHPYEIMYVKQNEPFYIGFHARNTRRLPYNVVCAVAEPSTDPNLPPFGKLHEFDNRYLATRR